MAKTASKLEQEALKLSPRQRGKLIDRLAESLDAGADPDAPKLWDREIDRRLDLDDKGRLRYLPAEKVLAEIRGLKRR